MFASKSTAEHLLRGVIGITGLIAVVVLAPLHPILSLCLAPIALLALRGCPMCWTLGLVETLTAKVRGRPHDTACDDGRCGFRVR